MPLMPMPPMPTKWILAWRERNRVMEVLRRALVASSAHPERSAGSDDRAPAAAPSALSLASRAGRRLRTFDFARYAGYAQRERKRARSRRTRAGVRVRLSSHLGRDPHA